MMQLRGTQPEFVDKAVETLESTSTRKTIMVAPVAYGKSICIANIVSNLEGPCIILQPTKELLEQNYNKYVSYGNEASIFSASLKSKELGHVTYATVKSIKASVTKVKSMKFKYLIIDECHLATGTKSETAKFIKDSGIKNILGVTATPVLLHPSFDGTMLKMMDRAQKNIFSSIGHVVQIMELVKAKYWSKLVYEIWVNSVPHLEYTSTGSDYTQKSMDIAYVESESEKKCIQAIDALREEGRKSILVFVPSVNAAKELSAKVKGSRYIHGGTNTKDRKTIIDGFKNLEMDVVINVEILTTGFDHPQLDAIVMARPTASIALYYQILGRGTRKHEKKENTKIIDVSGNVSNFGPIEYLNYDYIEGYGWGMFSQDECLTHNPIRAQHRRPTKESLRREYTQKAIAAARPDHKVKLWFGKHDGKTLDCVPKDYLSYILDNFSFDSPRSVSLKKSIEKVMMI